MAWYTGLMRTLTRWTRGYDTPRALAEMMLERYGFRGMMVWGKKADDIVAKAAKYWGPAHAQFHMGMAGVFYGCTYCSRGHLYATSLYVFRDEDRLFPVSEVDILELMELTDDQLLATIQERLDGTEGDRALAARTARQMALAHGEAEVETEEDRYLAAINGLWDWVTSCTVPIGKVEDVDPQASIARDKALRARYHAARKAAEAKGGDDAV